MPEAAVERAQTFAPEGTLLAFDFGTKRIGIAMGNTLLRRANPLTTISDEKTDTRFAKIETLLKEWQPTGLVVGCRAMTTVRRTN